MGQGPSQEDAPDDGTFECHRCGTCCTNLQDLWSDGQAPFTSLAGERIYRLPTPGGLRVFAWEADRFPTDRLEPLLVVADDQRGKLVVLAYELDEVVCPNYAEGVGCTIYADRPMVCRAYPLLVVEGEAGPEVAISGRCPGHVAVEQAAAEAERPEPVLARAYPEEFAPALAVPATVQALSAIVGFLEAAAVVSPIPGLAEDEVQRWKGNGTVDLVALAEQAGAFTREDLSERARSIRQRLRERWAPGQG